MIININHTLYYLWIGCCNIYSGSLNYKIYYLRLIVKAIKIE